MFARFLRLGALALLLPLSAAAALPAGVTEGASVEGVSQFTLANGLEVLLFPDATKPTTTVSVTYRVGSRQESYGETGMAHLLEHMLFKGTPSIPNLSIELARRGMRNNATTSFDRTAYFESFQASPENLDWVLQMEAERMTRSTFSKAELDTEMTVVRNEFENGENNPRLVLWKRMQAVAFDWHNYSHAAIGARSDIENVPFANLRAFYARYYQPDNAVLVVAGKFDPDAALAAIARHFGPIPRPARALPRPYTEEPVQDGERTVIVRRASGTQFLGALFHTPPGAHADSTALEAFGEIMAITPAGRLYQALVETKKATSVQSWQLAQHDPGSLIFWAQVPTADSLDTARTTLLDTLWAVKTKPVTDDELARVRTKALKDFDDIVNDPDQFATTISEAIAQGDWRLMFLQRDRWRALTAADVQRVALAYVKPSNLTLGMFIPESAPDRAPIVAKVDVPAMVTGYKGDPPIAAGETFDPSPANLEARTQRHTLASGMKLVLLSKKTRGETVHFQLMLGVGNAETLRGTSPAGGLAAAMLKRGTTKRDRQAFEDALDKYKAKLEFGGGAGTVVAQGETVRANLPAVLALLTEALQEPAFVPSEFEKLQRERLTSLAQSRVEPGPVAGRALARHDNPYPSDDVRYAPTFDEEAKRLEGATLDAVKAFHKRFYGAANAQLAIVGDFDADAARAQVAQLLGGWSSSAAYARVPQPYRPTKPVALQFETPDKANAYLRGSHAFPANDSAADFPALMVAGELLGNGDISRLFNRIRERDGLSYSVGSVLAPSAIDENSRFIFYAIFAPAALPKIRAAFDEEIGRAVQDGFTDDEVANAKKALLQERQLERSEDASLVESLVTQAHVGRTWAFSGKVDDAIAAATKEQVGGALRKYLRPGEIAYAVAGEFAKK
jgi:zinc protease